MLPGSSPEIPVSSSSDRKRMADLQRLLEVCMSAGAGAVVTLVAFRTRFAVLETSIANRDKAMKEEFDRRTLELEAIEKRIDTRLDALDRRTIMSLQILADIAKKVGVDQRFSDTLVRFLADESPSAQPR